jgi:intracellular sulfur oxidation DsrE/DsrF family protein
VDRYFLVESRDSFESTAARDHVEWAALLRRRGREVTLYLVQNAVLACRSGASKEELQEAFAAGIEVLADDFSLRERGIPEADIARGVRTASIGLIVERLASGWKVLFL